MCHNIDPCNKCNKPKCNHEQDCIEKCICTEPNYEHLGCVDFPDLTCILLKKDYPCLQLKKGESFDKLLDKLESLQCLNNDVNCDCDIPSSLAISFDQRGLNNPLLYRVRLIWQPVLNATGYIIEYKPTNSLNWMPLINTNLTSYNGLVVDNNIKNYDFRLKAICQNCSSDWFYKNNQILVECEAPSNAYYDSINNTLVWTSAPNQSSGTFVVEMRREDQTNFTTINVNAVETPLGSGIYIASLNSVPVSPNYVYHFCISNVCGSTQNVYSDHGSGCAYDCAIPNQTTPSVSNITSNSATINWDPIVGVYIYTITYTNNNITNTITVDAPDISYTITGLNTLLSTTVTVKGSCSKVDLTSPCGGKTIIF